MRWRVLGSYNPREQWLCTALRRGERRCIDWVRRKERFCANICTLMNIHYHTNLNNLRQLAGSSRASLLFSPHIRLLAGAVTPRLPGDSSPSPAFLRGGIRWLLAFARRFIIWLTAALRRGPLHYWRVGERLKQGLHVTLNEWESGVLYTRQPLMWGWYRVNKRAVSSKTRQPLMWGWYHVNERVSSTHGRPLWGGWYRVNKRAVSSKHGSRWCGAGIVRIREQCLPNMAAADVGLVSCEWESVLYTRQTAVGGLVSCE